MTSVQPWTAASIDTALVHINTVLARLRRNPDGVIDDHVVEEARQLKDYLAEHPTACTPDGRDCCTKLLEISGA